jgi:molybdopterin converting factor small subunit
MKIKLTYTGYLKFNGAETGSFIDVEPGSTLGDLLAGFDVARDQQRFLRLFANQETVDSSYLLREGDELTVIMQIGGG